MLFRKHRRSLGICDARPQAQCRLHLADAGKGFLRPGIELRGAAERFKQLGHKTVESDETSNTQSAREHAVSATADNGGHRQNNRERTPNRKPCGGAIESLL